MKISKLFLVALAIPPFAAPLLIQGLFLAFMWMHGVEPDRHDTVFLIGLSMLAGMPGGVIASLAIYEKCNKQPPSPAAAIVPESARGGRKDREMDLNDYAREAHAANKKWWQDIHTQEPIKRNKGELLCLIHSELSECMEGERKGLMDDKLPHRRMAEVELADALIRIFDYAGGFGYDLQGAYEDKMAFNAARVDHTHEARAAEGGKRF